MSQLPAVLFIDRDGTLVIEPEDQQVDRLDKVRFVSPVPVGANLRLGAELTKVDDLPGNGAQVYMTFTFEIEGSEKPAAVAEIIFRYYE